MSLGGTPALHAPCADVSIMKISIFTITLGGEILLAASLLLSIMRPQNRVWPPPGRGSCQFWWMWVLTEGAMLGTIVVSVLDWNKFLYFHWSRFIFGSVFFVAGVWLALWSIKTLSVKSSFGLKGKLVTIGPYSYSRNPQYVGTIVYLLAFPIITNSILSWVLCLFGVACFGLAPFAEEPWLRDQYGSEYEEYYNRVPRFLRLRSLKEIKH